MAMPSHLKVSGGAADFTLQIAPMMVELAPQVVISTIGYNNQVPGPLLRMREANGSPSTLRMTRTFRNMCTGMGCSFPRK